MKVGANLLKVSSFFVSKIKMKEGLHMNLSKEQQHLLAEFRKNWEQRKQRGFSCKTAVVAVTLDYLQGNQEVEVMGEDIDSCVLLFLKENEVA